MLPFKTGAEFTISIQALSSATGSIQAAIPIFDTIGWSLCPQQSQFGDMSVKKFMWKQDLSFIAAHAYYAIFSLTVSKASFQSAEAALYIHMATHWLQPVHLE